MSKILRFSSSHDIDHQHSFILVFTIKHLKDLDGQSEDTRLITLRVFDKMHEEQDKSVSLIND